MTRAGDRLVGTVAGGDFLTIARALGPNEGRDADFVPTSATEFMLVGDTTLLDEAPATFSAGPDGKVTLVLSGQPFGTRQ